MIPKRLLLSVGMTCFGLRICFAADVPGGVPAEFVKDVEKLMKADAKPWVEAAEHWSCAIKMDPSNSKNAVLLVEMKNVTTSERFLIAKHTFASYEFLWKGKKPELRPEYARTSGTVDLVGARRLHQFAGPNETVPDNIPLSTFFDIKPGVAYSLRVKRFLDEGDGYMKNEDRAAVVSNEISFELPR